jgi:hypothetical protein
VVVFSHNGNLLCHRGPQSRSKLLPMGNTGRGGFAGNHHRGFGGCGSRFHTHIARSLCHFLHKGSLGCHSPQRPSWLANYCEHAPPACGSCKFNTEALGQDSSWTDRPGGSCWKAFLRVGSPKSGCATMPSHITQQTGLNRRAGAAEGLRELHRWPVTAHLWSAALHAGAIEQTKSCRKAHLLKAG